MNSTKTKKTTIAPLNCKNPNYCQPLQHNVEKALVRDKIKEKDIFEMMNAKKSVVKKNVKSTAKSKKGKKSKKI
tara:strand:- start:1860 stop:2081 length:222 start_codon:yes stop_codon:yes gene_type:complete